MTNATLEIIDIKGDLSNIEGKPTYPELVLEGEFAEKTLALFRGENDRFESGIWASSPGKMQIPGAPFSEFTYLIKGRVRLISESGEVKEYAAGDAFVLPSGFVGTWETVEAVEKYYAALYDS